ncbi:MAG: DnaJ domain-containing protein [Deltaproteobacteria bacterium]|nr:DnaJ domain-containing protein [Deltaproteobacteria bacterium]
MNPYEVLGISIDADDSAIRDAYLLRIWQYSPKRYPEKFKEINDAYDKIRNKKSRLEYYLFNRDERLKIFHLGH